jgi:hypothetical protein
MSEPMTRFERRLESALRDYVERPDLTWAPREVVADVTARARVASPPRSSWFMPARLATAAVVILAVGLIAVVGTQLVDRSSIGIYPAMAVVNGVDYAVGVNRGMRIDSRDLTPYAQVESGNNLEQFADLTAFSLDGLDPLAVLVVHAAPGLSDDNGPYGDYLLLHGPEDAYPEICTFYDPGHPSSPTECHPVLPETPAPRRSATATTHHPEAPASPLSLASLSTSQSPTAVAGPSASVFDRGKVTDHLLALLRERTSPGHCGYEVQVDFNTRAVRQRADALAESGERDVDGDFVLGSLADTIEVLGGTELVAMQGPDIAWYLSDPAYVELILDPGFESELIALELQRIGLDDGREVWWRTLGYVAVGPC